MRTFLHSLRRTHVSVFIISILITIITIITFTAVQSRVYAASPAVEPISPTNNSYATGAVTLSSRVNGLEHDKYEMFWAVGEGEWSRMTTNTSTNISSATIDVSGWNWRSDNRYTIRFIVLIKEGWRPVESSVTLIKGQPPASPPSSTAPAPTPVATTQPTLSAPIAPLAQTGNSGLYVDPNSTPAQQRANRQGNQALEYIASQPIARWFGDWNGNVGSDVDSYVSQAAAAGKIPALVLYNIPRRDCGSYSAGGSQNQSNYLNWVQQIANGINNRPAIIVLEPDALASMGCLDAGERTTRMSTISQAVRLLKTNQSKVYIDAGHPGWHSTGTMASRLRQSGIDIADGFSLNVSNFRTTDDNVRYGTSLSSQVDGAHFVIDTSRNGNGPAADGEWCNPEGRSLGDAPTLAVNRNLVDAYLWIKTPGDSDGSCGRGAPAAGQWWQPYAEMLYNNRR